MGWPLGLIWPSIIIGLPGFCLLLLPWAKEEKNPISPFQTSSNLWKSLSQDVDNNCESLLRLFLLNFNVVELSQFYFKGKDGKQKLLSSCPFFEKRVLQKHILVLSSSVLDKYLHLGEPKGTAYRSGEAITFLQASLLGKLLLGQEQNQ